MPDVTKIEILGAQDEQIFLEFSTARLAGLGLTYSALLGQLQAQNLVRPTGVLQTGDERIFLRVAGAFESEDDIKAVNLAVGERLIPLRDIAEVRRGFSDPPLPLFHVNGKPAIGLAIAMREGGDILALGANLKKEMADIRANLPLGIEPFLVSDQAVVVDLAINDFMASLWQAILIILAASFVSLGVRPGSVVALAIPLTLAIVFAVMLIVGIDLQRISLGALIIALTLLVDDAMTTVDAMIRRLAAGDSKEQAATFAYKTLAAPMLIGTLITIAGFVPIGFAQELGGRVHVLDLRGGRDRADHVVARGGDLRAGDRHRDTEGAQDVGRGGEAERPHARISRPARRRDAREVADHRGDDRRVRGGGLPAAVRAGAVLSRVRPARAPRRPDAAAERVDLRLRNDRQAAGGGARRRTRTSLTGAPTSAAARSASTCRSTCRARTPSSASS